VFEGYLLDLVELGGCDQDGAVGVGGGYVEEFGHAVEGLTGLAGHEEGDEVALVAEEWFNVVVGLVSQPPPAELYGVGGWWGWRGWAQGFLEVSEPRLPGHVVAPMAWLTLSSRRVRASSILCWS